MTTTIVPPITANVGQACFQCFKEATPDVKLQRCAGCKRVFFCGSACQKLNWKSHKALCKALSTLESDRLARPEGLTGLSATDPSHNDKLRRDNNDQEQKLVGQALGRELNVIERNLLCWQPRCMACTRNERHLRLDAADEPSSTPNTTLTPCPVCRLTFFCSETHLEAVIAIHKDHPHPDSPEGLSACAMNRQIYEDVLLRSAIVASGDEQESVVWAPERTLSSWISVVAPPRTWTEEYGEQLKRSMGLPDRIPMPPWVRSASRPLSMPMTILWGLEKLNEDDAWTRKSTLNIHIIGAFQDEIKGAMVMEEILHRLSAVQTLRIFYCGPQLAQLINFSSRSGPTMEMEMETCPSCRAKGRKRLAVYSHEKYHDYALRLGSRFDLPDLAIAFNSGLSENSTLTPTAQINPSWQPTLKLLVNKKIPSVFTSYNREEAELEAQVLQHSSIGAHLKFGPVLNQWGSQLSIQEPIVVSGYYSVNRWIAGGFKG